MNISLQDIESAIRRNFLLAPEGESLLETEPDTDRHGEGNQSARLVFVGCAIERGFGAKEVCDYLNITGKDFYGKSVRYREMLRAGREKAARLRREGVVVRDMIDKHDGDRDMRICRKVMLVNNCLELLLHAKSLELRQSLPYYVD